MNHYHITLCLDAETLDEAERAAEVMANANEMIVASVIEDNEKE